MANVAVLNTSAQLTGKTLAVLERSDVYSGNNTFSGDNFFTGANLFTGANVFTGALAAGDAASPAISFDAEAGLGWYRSAVSTMSLASNNIRTLSMGYGTTTGPFFSLPSGAYGATAGFMSPTITIGRNSSGSTAPGQLELVDKAGVSYWLWVSSTGKLYLGTAAVQADGTPNDTSGTIVGTQT